MRIQMTKFKRLFLFLEMISNRLKTYGLKSSQTSMAHKITDIMVNHQSAHLQTSSKKYIVMQSNSSTNIK